MSEEATVRALPAIIREIPISLVLTEIEYDGKRLWVALYRAEVDGKSFESVVEYLLGAAHPDPETALKACARRPGLF